MFLNLKFEVSDDLNRYVSKSSKEVFGSRFLEINEIEWTVFHVCALVWMWTRSIYVVFTNWGIAVPAIEYDCLWFQLVIIQA